MTGNGNNLPDFDDMDKVAKIVADAKARLEDAKNFLDAYISDCVKAAMISKDYWINGKPPTMSYVDRVIAIEGNTKEDKEILKNARQEIVNQIQRYQEARGLLDNMKDRIGVWQTTSANMRKVNL